MSEMERDGQVTDGPGSARRGLVPGALPGRAGTRAAAHVLPVLTMTTFARVLRNAPYCT